MRGWEDLLQTFFGVRRHMNDWLEAEQRVERAQQLSESQRWEEALTEIDVALSINPNNAMWHAHRGYILEELDRFEEAAQAYGAARELEPGDRDVAVALGINLARLGRLSRALGVFDELARVYPDFEPAYSHRIGIYAELGQHDKAEEMFYLSQELDEASPHSFFHMGVSLAARERFDRAIYCWQRVLELSPDYIGVNRLIAQAYRAQKRLDLAKEYYLREVRDDPGNIDLLYELAELTVEAGELATAAAKFEQIVELDPEHVESRFALGKTWLLRGQPGKALTCFEAIRSITGEEADLPRFEAKLGEALFQLGRFAEAREQLELAVGKDPGATDIRLLLGNCLLGMDKLGEAGDAFRRVLASDADNPVAHHRLGICLIRQRRYAAGLDHFLHAIRAKPDFGPAMYMAVLAHLHLAQWREARSMLRRAMRRYPDNPDLRQLGKRLWRYRLRHGLHRVFELLGGPFGSRQP